MEEITTKELIDVLRICGNDMMTCDDCPMRYEYPNHLRFICQSSLMYEAALRLEKGDQK